MGVEVAGDRIEVHLSYKSKFALSIVNYVNTNSED
jgi:hypothetical protein